MSDIELEDVVANAAQSLHECNAPPTLQATIDRHSRTLLSLASNLLQSGMDEPHVRDVIDRVCASYRDELGAAVLTLRRSNERTSETQ